MAEPAMHLMSSNKFGRDGLRLTACGVNLGGVCSTNHFAGVTCKRCRKTIEYEVEERADRFKKEKAA